MDDYENQYYEETGHAVTPEEAVRGLLSAVVLRGVMDYRDALLNNICANEYGEYYISQSHTIKELEFFFRNIGFDLHRTLPDKILEFKREMDRLTMEDFEPGNEKSYICPICGGVVSCRKVKLAPQHTCNGKKLYENKVFCKGCLMRGTVY